MSDRTRRVRQTPVSECVARLPIEPLLVGPDDDPLTVMRSGTPITFAVFLRYGLVVTVVSLAISRAYLHLRYL